MQSQIRSVSLSFLRPRAAVVDRAASGSFTAPLVLLCPRFYLRSSTFSYAFLRSFFLQRSTSSFSPSSSFSSFSSALFRCCHVFLVSVGQGLDRDHPRGDFVDSVITIASLRERNCCVGSDESQTYRYEGDWWRKKKLQSLKARHPWNLGSFPRPTYRLNRARWIEADVDRKR